MSSVLDPTAMECRGFRAFFWAFSQIRKTDPHHSSTEDRGLLPQGCAYLILLAYFILINQVFQRQFVATNT